MCERVIRRLSITNPKRAGSATGIYSYYAGYSPLFAEEIIKSAELQKQDLIVDPWNGSGTTTSVSHALGYNSIGVDLNPVMAIVAKANLISPYEQSSIWPICQNVLKKARRHSIVEIDLANDTLLTWLHPSAVERIRKMEKAIQLLLVDENHYRLLSEWRSTDNLSSLAALYYVALFKTVRRILKPFFTSNPTWIKKPVKPARRLRPSFELIVHEFQGEVRSIISAISTRRNQRGNSPESIIRVGTSTQLAIKDASVDFMLTSPPYCTRIDYAVATLPELSILGFTEETFRRLRVDMIGTTAIAKGSIQRSPDWGATCLKFLDSMQGHQSKASNSYYLRSHLQYFDGVFRSLSEIARVLKQNGTAIFVVQNSYYKDIYNDLCRSYEEMAANNALRMVRREDFKVNRAMVGLNSAAKKYRSKYEVIESVICFSKQ